ncbi:dTDP-4-dehydrorhamnose reductase [Patescibacteria group bacterium]|nr:dTDP-4-dehydrorhamnose reductase [Patescibacteria group bacterium]
MCKKDKLKIFITGASGMLGTTLYDVFTSVGYDIISTDLSPLDPWSLQLDIRNKKAIEIMIKDTKPDFVFNLAALTDVEYCEKHPQESYDTNARGAINVAEVCRDFETPLVHISTVGVFDGTKGEPYTEYDDPNPVNSYGKAKHEAEKAIPQILDNHFIFRAGWMMGGKDRDKKFVSKICNQIKNGATTLYALDDMFGCPTYTRDFSEGIFRMLDTKDYGLYNMGNEGYCSRYGVAKRIVDILGFNHIKVEPVKKGFFAKDYFAPRPAFEVLENKKLHDKGYFIMRNWEEALVEYLKLL